MYLYKMKRIETRDNEFLMQFRDTLRDSFPHALKLTVDYYVGEDKGVRGLYFTLTSRFGLLYSRTIKMKDGETVLDVEEPFMDKVINDLVLQGISFLNLLAFDSVNPEKVVREIEAVPFRSSSPRRLIYQN